jgi:hypothetical protein
MEGS